MKMLCDFHGLVQLVHEPTRKEYLLDLAITIVGASVSVLPYIADHKAIQVKLPIPEVKEVAVERTVWLLKLANWQALENELGDIDWKILDNGTAEDALNVFMDVLWTLLVKHIPQKQLTCTRSSHPWLNSRRRVAIIRKKSMQKARTLFQ